MRTVMMTTFALLASCGDAEGPSDVDPPAAAIDMGGIPAPAVAAEEATPPAAAEPTVATGYAVVRGGAPVFLTADPDGPGVELVRPEGRQAPDDRPWGAAVYVLGEEDGLLRVDTVGASTGQTHCGDVPDGIDDFRLRLYVDPADLQPVTTKPVRAEFSDGTSIELAPGVPVRAEGDHFIAAAGESRLVLPIPATSVGDRYEPGRPYDREPSVGKFYGEAPLAYDRGQELPRGGLYAEDFGTTDYFAMTPAPDDRLAVTVRMACAEIVGLVDRARLASPTAPEDVWGGLTEADLSGYYGVGGSGRSGVAGGTAEPTFQVRAGALVHWQDDTTAGQVVTAHEFADKPRDHEGRLCFEAALYRKLPAALTLCFEPGDVTQIEATAPPPVVLGTLGAGTGSSAASGYPTGPSVRKRVPKVTTSKATTVGSLDKDVIRRIVRAHINEVRYCYNQGLVKDPTLEGKVSITFVVGPSGAVTSTKVGSSTLSNTKVETCVANAVRRWKFPKPTGGGVVSVSYPFVFSPS